MKYLLSLILVLFSVTAYAESGFYYNPERSGEGLIQTIDADNRLAFGFFTYWDADINQPPIPSPNPHWIYYDPPCRNCLAWFVGTAAFVDGAAMGVMTMSLPYDYPTPEPYTGDPPTSPYKLDEVVPVATFLITENGEGFDMVIDCYEGESLLPPSLYLCNTVFTFTRKIIGE